MSTHNTKTKKNAVRRIHPSGAIARDDRNNVIIGQEGDTDPVTVTATSLQDKEIRSNNKSTKKDDKYNAHNANRDGGLYEITTTLLNEIDNEIIHAEETDLMFKYYKQLQEKVRWETRGQHNDKFYDMINYNTNKMKSKSKSSNSIPKGKAASQQVRQPQASPKQAKKINETSKTFNEDVVATTTTTSAVLLEDDDNENSSGLNTQSMLILPKSRRRRRNQNTDTSNENDNHSNLNQNRKRQRRRPRLKLYDTTVDGTIPTTNGIYSAVLRDSLEVVNDLQLVRATMLLPRMFSSTNKKTTTSSKTANATMKISDENGKSEWKKNELERYLRTKFWKNCIKHRRMYCMHHHSDSYDGGGDTSTNIYWKHFHIQVQSANMNSWRCIVIGYRNMVHDVLLFLRQLKLISQQNRNIHDNKSTGTTTTTTSSSAAIRDR